MTTMDSDSESQDSDEGRRFRFEATRKDAGAIQSRRKDNSSHRNSSRRRSRSRENNRSHRRPSIDRRRDRNTDERRCSKERTDDRRNSKERNEDKRSSKERNDNRRNSKERNDDRRTSKERKMDVRKKEERQKEKPLHRDLRDSKSREDRRNSRPRDEKRKRSSERHRSREKLRRHSRERSRQKSSDRNSRDDKLKSHDSTKRSRDSQKIDKSSESQDCKDLNLSDFDIVSDTEGNSDSDDVFEAKNDKFGRIDRNSEDEDKVNHRNDEKSSNLSNTNDLSDNLLASTSGKSVDKGSFRSDGEMLMNEEEADEIYGPTLPPSIKSQGISEISSENNKVDKRGKEVVKEKYKEIDNAEEIEKVKGEKVRVIGPSLPDHLKKLLTQDDGGESHEKNHDVDGEDDAFGPALPPHLQKKQKERVLGPSLPVNSDAVDMNEDDDDDVGGLGPLPADHPAMKDDFVQRQLEYRARLIKRELAEIDSIEDKKREEWMTELPAVRQASLGLGPRKFRTREGPDLSDRSSWTDTPADRAKKEKEKAMGKVKVDEKQADESLPEKSSKRKEKSLMEMHQKKLQKKKKKKEREDKKAGKAPERRPFDRDIDLQVNRFDDARKKSILMKAAALDDRFSRGKI